MESPDYLFKVVVIGNTPAATGELLRRYRFKNMPEDNKLTIGTDLGLKKIKFQGKLVNLQLFGVDIEGRFQFLFPQICTGANGAIILYDVTDADTITGLKGWVQIVRDKTVDVPIVLIGNSRDLSKPRNVSLEEADNLVKEHSLSGHLEISTDTGKNVEKMFETITTLMVNQ